MKTETHSTKSESRRDFEVFRKRLLAELQIHQDRVDRARNELPVESDPDDDAGVATRSAYREVTMGKLERDLQTIVEIERVWGGWTEDSTQRALAVNRASQTLV